MLIASMHDALRGLRRSATFTAIVFLTLSVSIGAAVAMFGIVDQMYFRPISLMREPGTAHRVYTQRLTRQSGRVTSHSMNYGQYLDLAAMTSSFSEMAVFSEDRMPVGTGATSREVVVSAVSESYFNFFNALWKCNASFAGTFIKDKVEVYVLVVRSCAVIDFIECFRIKQVSRKGSKTL